MSNYPSCKAPRCDNEAPQSRTQPSTKEAPNPQGAMESKPRAVPQERGLSEHGACPWRLADLTPLPGRVTAGTQTSLRLAAIVVLLVCATFLGGCSASAPFGVLQDGTYLVEVTLDGGTGKAHVTSPTEVTIQNGQATATLEWSSPNYDYMVVNDERILPSNKTGNSTFEIPVAEFDKPLPVVADTTAMSTPHEITYELTFSSQNMQKAG